MNYTEKAVILDEAAIVRSLKRISHEIIEQDAGDTGFCLIGIRRRGIPLAHIIAGYIRDFSGYSAPVGELDITLYRDDLSELSEQPTLSRSNIPFDISKKTVILVDDVVFTGRTARAAIEAIIKLGRPACVRLAVLIDRGHRELPIRPDYVGKNVPTSRKELIEVRIPEFDGRFEVAILEQSEGPAE